MADARGEVAPVVGRRRRPELVADHGPRRPRGRRGGEARRARRASPRRPNTRANAARSAPSTAATAARGSPNQGLSSTRAQTAVTTRPPGATTRASSRRTRNRIGGDHQREPAHGRREGAVVERERLGHVGVEEGGIDRRPTGAFAGGGEPRIAHVDAGDRRPAQRQLHGQPAAPAADIEHRRGAVGRGEDLGEARRRPPAVIHAETPPMYRAGSASNRARQPEQQK